MAILKSIEEYERVLAEYRADIHLIDDIMERIQRNDSMEERVNCAKSLGNALARASTNIWHLNETVQFVELFAELLKRSLGDRDNDVVADLDMRRVLLSVTPDTAEHMGCAIYSILPKTQYRAKLAKAWFDDDVAEFKKLGKRADEEWEQRVWAKSTSVSADEIWKG